MKQDHFTYHEWQTFKQKTVALEQTAAMEIHLQECEDCQELYLNLFDQDDINLAQPSIPLDFTDALINRLSQQLPVPQISALPSPKPDINRKSVFAYYVTAAAITLALMSGGVFDSMVDQSMRFSRICMTQSQNIEKQVNNNLGLQFQKEPAQWMDKHLLENERNVKHAK